MFHANNISARSYVRTFENRNVIHFNLYKNIHKNIFILKSAEKLDYSASPKKKQYFFLEKKKSVVDLKNVIYNMDGLIGASSAL